MLLIAPGDQPEVRLCDCTQGRKKARTCDHILELAAIARAWFKLSGGRTLQDFFQTGLWTTLAGILGDGGRENLADVAVRKYGTGNHAHLRVVTTKGQELARYYSGESDAALLADRLGRVPDQPGRSRAQVLERLQLSTMSDHERLLRQKGLETIRMVAEQSAWTRIAYHLYLEFGPHALNMAPTVDAKTGDFTVAGHLPDGRLVLRLIVPRERVRAVIDTLGHHLPNPHGLPIQPVPLKSIFKVASNTQLDLDIRPGIQMLQAIGEARLINAVDFPLFRYGHLVYLKDLGLMSELEHGPERRFRAPLQMALKKSRVDAFVEEHAAEIPGEQVVAVVKAKGMNVVRTYDRVEIDPRAIDRDWYWLDVRYGFGRATISLARLLEARAQGERYLETEVGWVDCRAEAFDRLSAELEEHGEEEEGAWKMSRLDLFRLVTTTDTPLVIGGDPARKELLQRLLDLKPARNDMAPPEMTSELRPYQVVGFRWLLFLLENRLGGILGDDMGLGKTHQVLALLAGLDQVEEMAGPTLVVCPTTVLSHWLNKTKHQTPSLRPWLFHGPDRHLPTPLPPGSVVLTSYGLLFNDRERLGAVDWSVVVFDEAHTLKNPQTQTYAAAHDIPAQVKIGLTGTPIENRVEDLTALLDLVLPGYLDDSCRKRLVGRANGSRSGSRMEASRMISPFILRRTKAAVLPELPDKVEDLRTCRLSEEQVHLYREAVQARGAGLIDIIRAGREPVPYIHIFALLNLLKRICDHPALVAREPEKHEHYQSGKWELFRDVLSECLEQGEKVVVYSQFLDMIRIMELHLAAQGVGFVTLTGASRDRGGIVARFENDPACRVFVGSLKAGGVGIDLVAASKVIHYDRWWNPARENQATDRVHRMGQRRMVQVFKLVTEGTLEEKIDAIIERKKALAAELIQEDDPGLLKTCQREELIELLSFGFGGR